VKASVNYPVNRALYLSAQAGILFNGSQERDYDLALHAEFFQMFRVGFGMKRETIHFAGFPAENIYYLSVGLQLSKFFFTDTYVASFPYLQ
jgi:hypothetical protein